MEEPPTGSFDSPPLPDDSPGSPPSSDGGSDSPSPPDSGSDSPPPPDGGSDSPPPPDGGSDFPPPPDGGSETPPPFDGGSDSPPPPDGGSETPPPPDGGSDSPPPPPPDGDSDSPPPPPPDGGSDSPPPPAVSEVPMLPSPPAPVQYTPPPPPPNSPLMLSPPEQTVPPPHKSVVPVAAGSAAAGTILLVLAVYIVVVVLRKRRVALGDREVGATDTTMTTPPPAPMIGSGKSPTQRPKSPSVYTPKSVPAGPPGEPQKHHSVELSPPPTTASSDSSATASLAFSGASSNKSQCDRQRGQPLPAGEVLFRGAFEYGELAAATNGFSDSNLVGHGGFGDVYAGTVDGMAVAVKQLRAGSEQGDSEFQAELQIINRVHHRNLVSLVGYCVGDDGQRLLVYEFVPNSTLHHHLHGNVEAVLDWPTRWKIAVGATKGLAYLHEDCHPRIIHRDIKAANILLDHDFNPKVSDFGMAKFIPRENTHIATRIVGTVGYLAPEYASSGKLTEKSDVFSFGVVLLELITGMSPAMSSNPEMEETLVGWARPLLTRALELGDYDELADPMMPGFDAEQMARLVRCAAAAISTSARSRPKMSQIVRYLVGDASADEIDACGVWPSSVGASGSANGDTSGQVRPVRYNEIRASRRQARVEKLHHA